eukprot:5118443-Pleurochrysis_carterae.AAC.1
MMPSLDAASQMSFLKLLLADIPPADAEVRACHVYPSKWRNASRLGKARQFADHESYTIPQKGASLSQTAIVWRDRKRSSLCGT